MEEASEQAWNQVANIQIKAVLRVFCFDLLPTFVLLSLCCPGCLFLVALASKWQCLRRPEAPVLSLQHVLELMCTNSSVDGEGKHSPDTAQLVHYGSPGVNLLPHTCLPETLPSKPMDTWDRQPGQFQKQGFWKTAHWSPLLKKWG